VGYPLQAGCIHHYGVRGWVLVNGDIQMNKQEMIEIFPSMAKSAVRMNQDGPYLHGHFVEISWVDNTWDIYVRDMKNIGNMLGTGKINNILATVPPSIKPTQANGEAWWQTPDIDLLKEWLDNNRVALGISKRVARDKSTYRIKGLSGL